jgi:hypothetical protein
MATVNEERIELLIPGRTDGASREAMNVRVKIVGRVGLVSAFNLEDSLPWASRKASRGLM